MLGRNLGDIGNDGKGILTDAMWSQIQAIPLRKVNGSGCRHSYTQSFGLTRSSRHGSSVGTFSFPPKKRGQAKTLRVHAQVGLLPRRQPACGTLRHCPLHPRQWGAVSGRAGAGGAGPYAPSVATATRASAPPGRELQKRLTQAGKVSQFAPMAAMRRMVFPANALRPRFVEHPGSRCRTTAENYMKPLERRPGRSEPRAGANSPTANRTGPLRSRVERHRINGMEYLNEAVPGLS